MNISKQIKRNQIVSIVGSTATGKTALALELAQALIKGKFAKQVHLLSADSRQVYKGLGQLTGADIPAGFRKVESDLFSYPFLQNKAQTILLHGVAMVGVEDEWSAAHFSRLFQEIKKSLDDESALIVVGGTGFYQKQIDNKAETLEQAPNPVLRQKLEKLNVEELQNELGKCDPQKLEQMNNSDRNNPRRLVRSIELAQGNWSKENGKQVQVTEQASVPSFYLQIDPEIREQKIAARVQQRFEEAKKEVANILEKKTVQKSAMSSTGFQELAQFIEGKIDQATCRDLWTKAEVQYAKRQDTWWKKQKNLLEIKDRTNLEFMLKYFS